MKFRNLIEAIGIHPRTRRYHYQPEEVNLSDGTSFKYARWLHPLEFVKEFTLGLIDSHREIISPGDFCIDIGAHTGDSALPMAIATGREGCVLALEPNPYVYPVLEKTARLNYPALNIITLMAAATKEEGVTEFEYSDASFCNGGRHEGMNALQHGHMFKLEVAGINLETELKTDYAHWLPKIKFIKTDAEGYDLSVVQSLAGIIAGHRPFVKCEVFKKTSTKYRETLFDFFFEQDYAIHLVEGASVSPGRRLMLADVHHQSHYDFLAIPKEHA